MDCIVHVVAKSRTRLTNFHFHWVFQQKHHTLKWQNQIIKSYSFLLSIKQVSIVVLKVSSFMF